MFASCPHCGGAISTDVFTGGGIEEENNEELTLGQKIDRAVKLFFFWGIGLFLLWILLSEMSALGFKFDIAKFENPVISITNKEVPPTYPLSTETETKEVKEKPITKKIIYEIAKEEMITYDEQITHQYQIWTNEEAKVSIAESIKKIFKEEIHPKNEYIYIVDLFSENPNEFFEPYPISEWESLIGRFLYLNKVVLENEIIPEDYNEIGSNLYVKWQ